MSTELTTHTGDATRILIAEDNGVLSDVLRFNLERAGFEVTVADNGRAAVEQLAARRFDLLIADLQMPQLDGEGVCREARYTLALHDLPIVICSAKGLEVNAQRLSAAYNVSKIVFKPFSLREVVALAQSLVQSPLVTS